MNSVHKHTGFTLLEVLISFAILASILAVVIQSQSEMVFFLQKTKKTETVQSVVMNELFKLERESPKNIQNTSGTFSSNHVLAGSKWNIQVHDEKFLESITVKKVTYQVLWTEKGRLQTYELSIYK